MKKTYNGTDVWINWEEINQKIMNKKVICFGRGDWMEKTVNYLPGPIDYIVDNNKYEWDQTENGIPIYNPAKIKAENPDDIYVIITNTSSPAVCAQLIDFGLSPGIHFCVSPVLKSFSVISSINKHEQTVYFTCSDRYLENTPERGGGFYSIDIQTRHFTKLINGQCHGIVEGKDVIYLIDDIVGVRIVKNDQTFEPVTTFELPAKSRPHGIAYCPKRDLIFISLSGRDAIAIYHGKSYEMLGEIPFSNKFSRSKIAQHHLNDICVHNNSLFVSMFSFSGNWKIGVYDGGIYEIDIDSREIRHSVVSNLWMPHSPTMINGLLHYCDSMRGNVHNSTWKTFMTGFNGFIRGIVYDGAFYYVGQSPHRYLERCQGYSNNISLDSGIYIVENSGKVTKFLQTCDLVDINTVFIPSWSMV